MQQGYKIWYIHCSKSAVGQGAAIAGTQVLARADRMAQLAPVSFVSAQREADRWHPSEVLDRSVSFDFHIIQTGGILSHGLMFAGRGRGPAMLAELVARDDPSLVHILHCRSHYATLLGNAAKALLQRQGLEVRTIYDMEGIAPEEELYYPHLPGSSFSLSGTLRRWVRIALLPRIEQAGFSRADAAVTVSEVMKDHVFRKYNVRASSISVVPSTADPDIFHFSPQARAETRKNLNIGPEGNVFIYSGTLGRYQEPEMFVGIFARVAEIDTSAVLVVLSRWPDRIHDIIEEYGVEPGRVRVASAHFNEVHRYLSAADWGFCLRADNTVNKVASPTKVAEYMVCGVAPIVSPWVGDYSRVVREKDLGVVISDPRSPSSADLGRLLTLPAVQRKRIIDYATNNLSHDSALPIYRSLYERLSSAGQQ